MRPSLTLDSQTIGKPAQTGSDGIVSYLDNMVAEYDAVNDQCLFLPSLLNLSECFQCSAVEVHQALSELKIRGCDFFILSLESPITLWYPTRVNAK